MFALYRKVQDYADDDGEERQSLKASTSEREEPGKGPSRHTALSAQHRF